MSDDMMHDVQRYRQMVLDYEALDEEIDTYIIERGGKSEHEMTADELTHYRELSRRRDELLNEIRMLEHQLKLDEDTP
jgi:hypothetical protein